MNKVADIATLIVIVGGIMVMVRPRSQGPALLKSMTDGFANVLATATGGIPAGYKSTF